MINVIGNSESKIKKIFKKIEKEIFKYHNQKNFFYVEVVFVDGEEIKKVNGEWRKIERATDVLSFPNFDGLKLPVGLDGFGVQDRVGRKVGLGNIMICREVAEAQAKEYNHSLEREYGFLFCHGMLHLLGYDHMVENEEAEMVKLQKEILNRVGLER